MADEKQLTCPWCGGAVTTFEDYDWRWMCGNIECGASGPWRPTREAAIATLGDVRPDGSCPLCPQVLARAEKAEAAASKWELAATCERDRVTMAESERDEARAELAELREALDEMLAQGLVVAIDAGRMMRGVIGDRYCVCRGGIDGPCRDGTEPWHEHADDAVLAWWRERGKR